MRANHRLYDYVDRWGLTPEITFVGAFEVDTARPGVFDGKDHLLDAIEKRRTENPSGLPIVTIEGQTPVLFHIVHHLDEHDAIFQSIIIAQEWLERRWVCARKSYSIFSIAADIDPTWVDAATIPKSIWDWLKEPGL